MRFTAFCFMVLLSAFCTLAQAQTSPYPLSISANKRHFVNAQGQPHILVADTAWSILVELTATEIESYLDDRESRGVNAILINLVEHTFSSNSPKWETRTGILPFTNANDLSTYNTDYFDFAEWFIQEAADRNMVVIMTPAYMGFECGAEGWCGKVRSTGATKLGQYGQYLGAKFASYPNIIWSTSGDYTPTNSTDLNLINALTNGIIAGEGSGGVHMHLGHWGPNYAGMDVPGAARIDIDTTYTYIGTSNYFALLERWDDNEGVRPHIFFEGMYENEHLSNGADWRSQIYMPMVTGSTGFIFGNNPIWYFADPGDSHDTFGNGGFPGGWTTALNSPGIQNVTRAKNFFGSIAWQTLSPDVNHDFMISGYAGSAEEDYVQASINSTGNLAVVYYQSIRTPTFDMTEMAGSVTARWFDPAGGTYTTVSGSPFANTGTRTFTPPSTNADGLNDWVLLLEAEGSGPSNPIAYEQGSEQSVTSNSSSVATPAFSSNPTSGNLMVCAVVYNSNTLQVTSMSDNAGNSYTKAVGPVTSTSSVLANWRMEIWYRQNLVGGSSFVTTANFGSTFNAYKRISCHEYSGIAITGALDQAVGASGTTATGTVGPVTTTHANELLFMAGSVAGGVSAAGSGFTQRSTLDLDTVADRIVSSTGSYSATMSPTGNEWQMGLVTFKAAGSTTPPADTTDPTVSITSPANSANVTTSSTVAINVTASDNVGVSNVKIYVNGNLLCTDTNPPYSCNWSVPATPGSYSIQAVAIDAANNDDDHTISVTSSNPSSTPISHVQMEEQAVAANSSSVATPAFGSALTTGHLMVCAIVYESGSVQVSGVSDSAGNTYTKAVGPVNSSSGPLAGWRMEVWYKQNLAAGSSAVVTAAFGSTFSGYKRISCHQYAGIKTSGALDKTASANGTAATGTVGPVTTTQANELLFMAGSVAGGVSAAGSGFTQRSTYDNDTVADRIVSSTGSYSGTMAPTGGGFQMTLVTFNGL